MFIQAKERTYATSSSESYWVVNKKISKLFDLETAVFLSELFSRDKYFETKQEKEYDGWFPFSTKKIQEFTGFSYHIQTQCIQKLSKYFLILNQRRGNPARQYFFINYEAYDQIMGGELASLRGILKQDLDCFENKLLTASRTLRITKSNTLINNFTKLTVASKKTATASVKNKPYLPFAIQLKEIVQSKKNIKVTHQKVRSWAGSIRLLNETDEVSKERIEKALNWYKDHHEDDYVPVIESGKTLREKFIRLENAIERFNNPKKNKTSHRYKNKVKTNYTQNITIV